MPDYSWPSEDKRRLIGKPVNRIDGPVKASGKAEFSQDVKRPGMLYGAIVTSPYAHAKIRSVDTSAAEELTGVKSVRVISGPGTEIQWCGTEIAAVAAEREEIARDAARAIRVDYEVLPHLVKEDNLTTAQAHNRAKPAGEVVTGDPDQGFKDADVISEGEYGIPVVAHCCFESHGQVISWRDGKIEYFPSTQAVSNIGNDLAKGLEVSAAGVHVHQDHMGGGFGNEFQSDRWGQEAARLSKAAGGQPVKLHLDRRTELSIAGCRPSYFGRIKLGAKRDGTIIAWESQTWATGGFGGGGMNANLLPYVFRNVPNRRINHTAISINAGGAREWRAPNHPQVSFLANPRCLSPPRRCSRS